jgi:PleD family two-component response regulator
MAYSTAAQKGRRILVADDEPVNVALLSKRLQAAGHHVLTADSGQSALAVARAQQPDLILLDLVMPDLDGFAVLEALQSAVDTAHIPVIFVSAENDSARRADAIGRGGHDFISKPFHPEELLARVNAALRIKDAHDQLQRRQFELDRLARRDPLTGLYNRRHLEEVLAWELERTCSCHLPFSVLLLDLDHFKTINDTYGHPAGDQVLRELATLLTTRLRQEDTPGRFGGDQWNRRQPDRPHDPDHRGRSATLPRQARRAESSHARAHHVDEEGTLCCPKP